MVKTMVRPRLGKGVETAQRMAYPMKERWRAEGGGRM
jgi:hypothetical protein